MSKEIYIRVTTVDLTTGVETQSKVVNFSNSNTVKWLNSHMVWAFNNHHGVQIVNYDDRELEDKLYVE